MSRPACVIVRDLGGLANIDEVLHDAAFSMSEVQYADREGLAEIRLSWPGRNKDLSLRHVISRKPEQRKSYLLSIRSVTAVEVEDPQGLEVHSYARLVYADDGRLILESNFPGRVTLTVTHLDVRLDDEE